MCFQHLTVAIVASARNWHHSEATSGLKAVGSLLTLIIRIHTKTDSTLVGDNLEFSKLCSAVSFKLAGVLLLSWMVSTKPSLSLRSNYYLIFQRFADSASDIDEGFRENLFALALGETEKAGTSVLVENVINSLARYISRRIYLVSQHKSLKYLS